MAIIKKVDKYKHMTTNEKQYELERILMDQTQHGRLLLSSRLSIWTSSILLFYNYCTDNLQYISTIYVNNKRESA